MTATNTYVIIEAAPPVYVEVTPRSGPQAMFYTHNQSVASAVWTINHNLHGHPTAVVFDSANTQCEGDFSYPSVDTMVITFTSAFAGIAYVI